MAALRLCSIPDCGKPVFGRGWCCTHYKRNMRNGDPLKLVRKQQPKGVLLQWIKDHVGHDNDQCLIWPFGTKRATGHTGPIYYDGGYHAAYRVMCSEAHGRPPKPKMMAAHSCGNGHLGCVNPRHLRWATGAENSLDRSLHGRASSKLTQDEVRAIRLLAPTWSRRKISEQFQIGKSTVDAILWRTTWNWVGPD